VGVWGFWGGWLWFWGWLWGLWRFGDAIASPLLSGSSSSANQYTIARAGIRVPASAVSKKVNPLRRHNLLDKAWAEGSNPTIELESPFLPSMGRQGVTVTT